MSRQLNGFAASWLVVEAVAETGLGVGLAVSGLVGGSAICVAAGGESFGVGCFAGEELENMYDSWKLSRMPVNKKERKAFTMAVVRTHVLFGDRYLHCFHTPHSTFCSDLKLWGSSLYIMRFSLELRSDERRARIILDFRSLCSL